MCNSVTKGGSMHKSITYYVLMTLGVNPNTKGFRYLIDAIEIALKSKSIKLKMFEEIYNALGKKYGDKPLNVERAIRHSIQNCKDKEKKTMSNGKFLATIKLENKIKGVK